MRERRADERPVLRDQLDAALEVDGLGTLTVDVAFGGMWYAIADAAALGFELVPAEARDLCASASRSASPRASSWYPENPEIAGRSSSSPGRGGASGAVSRNAVVVSPGRLDRSATGTGLSARMAALHARGLMRVGDAMTHAP